MNFSNRLSLIPEAARVVKTNTHIAMNLQPPILAAMQCVGVLFQRHFVHCCRFFPHIMSYVLLVSYSFPCPGVSVHLSKSRYFTWTS